MGPYLKKLLNEVQEKNLLHAKKLRSSLAGLERDYYERAEEFFRRYETVLNAQGKELSNGIDSYLKMCGDVLSEQIAFRRTGAYSCASFADAEKRVYQNPEVMEYYMEGLVMSQFLWVHHYRILEYFSSTMEKYRAAVSSYLEIGAGHGLYTSEAIDVLNDGTTFTVIDISPTSLAMTRSLVGEEGRVRYILADIFKSQGEATHDFVTMGEVLEHVEDPVCLLKAIRSLLADDGTAFVTAPMNAPAIDHIYLFRTADDLRGVIHDAGLRIEDEFILCSEEVDEEQAKSLGVATMYAAVLKKEI